MEKKKSVIEKITLNAATFKNEGCNPTYINLFFGRNGAGKSSIAKAIAAGEGLTWNASENPDDYEILIYDQDFIEDNFSEYDNLLGVFTVNQVNIEIQKRIDALGVEKVQVVNEMSGLIDDGNKKKDVKESLLAQLQNECWSRSARLRNDFDATLSGKKRKNTFTEKILFTSNPKAHNLIKLKELYDVAFDSNSQAYGLLRKSSDASGRYDLSGEELMGRSIISSSDTPFAVFMKALGATDWVKNGHAHYVKNTDGKCPFCQQTMPRDFEKDVASCFDEQYQNDQNALAEFQAAYKSFTKSIWIVFEQNQSNVYPKLDMNSYRDKLAILQTTVTSNLRQIERKIESPALTMELVDIKTLIADIDAIIDVYNEQIKANNEVVNSKKAKKKECEDAVWEHLADMFSKEIADYRASLAAAEKDLTELGDKYKDKKQRSLQIQTEVLNLRNQTVNTGAAIDGINKLLKDSGFQGFSLRQKENNQDVYEVIRENGKVAEKLSEGEKNFIAFLYFYHLVRGSGKAGTSAMIRDVETSGYVRNVADNREKIVIIDDPVSSMDSNTLFIVSSLVREMIEVCNNNVDYAHRIMDGMYIKQIFILTHNAYFYREISCNQVSRYESVSFFMIRKVNNISTVECCENKPKSALENPSNRNPVQNSYTALWEEYKELNSTIPLLNVIRRILDYYFIQLCGYQEIDIRKTILETHKDAFVDAGSDGRKDYTKLHLATIMLSYIGSAESFIDGLNLVEDSTDAGQYKMVLEMIFDKLKQGQHFKMMTARKSD